MLICLGQATVSRESLISDSMAFLVRSGERVYGGAPPPYLVLPEYHAQVVEGRVRSLNEAGARYGYTFT